MPSIRRKIGLGSAAFVAIIALLALLSYSDLHYLERRIEAGVAIYDFIDALLELRLEEESFLLSADARHLTSALAHAESATRILVTHRRAFLALRNEQMDLDPGAVEVLLREYTAELSSWRQSAHSGQPGPVIDVHAMPGERLVAIAEALAKAERTALRDSVERSQGGLLVSIVVVALLGSAAARLLSLVSVRPLSWLEAELTAVGQGRKDQLRPITSDREIISVSRAVNQMLDEIALRNRHLLQSEKLSSLGTLASAVAHELNNPLSNISSSCRILIEEYEQQSVTDPLEWLGQIVDETERARHIVDSILDFSNENRVHKAPIDLREIIDRSLLLMGSQGSSRIDTSRVPRDTRIHADPQKLQQVFINLFMNALDAGAAGIQVRSHTMDNDDFHFPRGAVTGKRHCTAATKGHVLVIEVEDDGPGIAPQVLSRVFDPFFTTKAVGHGDGLGLYVTQEIIDLHGGCVGISSRPGMGTRFVIALPRMAHADGSYPIHDELGQGARSRMKPDT